MKTTKVHRNSIHPMPRAHRTWPRSSRANSARLPAALAQLSLEERVVIRLRYVEEKSVAQVARALNKTDGQIRIMERESMKRLRASFPGGDSLSERTAPREFRASMGGSGAAQ